MDTAEKNYNCTTITPLDIALEDDTDYDLYDEIYENTIIDTHMDTENPREMDVVSEILTLKKRIERNELETKKK